VVFEQLTHACRGEFDSSSVIRPCEEWSQSGTTRQSRSIVTNIRIFFLTPGLLRKLAKTTFNFYTGQPCVEHNRVEEVVIFYKFQSTKNGPL
jgi:hypothetical protein